MDHMFSCLAVTWAATLVLGCGDSGGGGGSSADQTTGATTVAGNQSTATTVTSSATSVSGTATTSATTVAGSSSSGTACLVPSPTYTAMGCLDFASAKAICGFGSDEKICEFSLGCGVSESVGQCKINCEQGSASLCNDMTKTMCVIDSYCTNDCAKLKTCGFIL